MLRGKKVSKGGISAIPALTHAFLEQFLGGFVA
jgi:hypothetical protein